MNKTKKGKTNETNKENKRIIIFYLTITKTLIILYMRLKKEDKNESIYKKFKRKKPKMETNNI